MQRDAFARQQKRAFRPELEVLALAQVDIPMMQLYTRSVWVSDHARLGYHTIRTGLVPSLELLKDALQVVVPSSSSSSPSLAHILDNWVEYTLLLHIASSTGDTSSKGVTISGVNKPRRVLITRMWRRLWAFAR